ncbi:hypothetical protein D3C84_885000 [compost metagenome]
MVDRMHQPQCLIVHHGKCCMHRLDWVQEARPGIQGHGLGYIHFVKSLIALPQRKPNIKIVVINGFYLDLLHKMLLKIG